MNVGLVTNLIRNHVSDLDEWGNALRANAPHHLEVLSHAISVSKGNDCSATVRALDSLIKPMQIDLYAALQVHGKNHPRYKDLSMEYDFLLGLIGYFKDNGYTPY